VSINDGAYMPSNEDISCENDIFYHYVYFKIILRIHYNIIFLYELSIDFLTVMNIK